MNREPNFAVWWRAAPNDDWHLLEWRDTKAEADEVVRETRTHGHEAKAGEKLAEEG